MATLRVNLVEVRAISAALRANSESRFSDLQSLGARVNPDAVWEGRRPSSYTEAYKRWHDATTNFVQTQRDLGRELERIVDQYSCVCGGCYSSSGSSPTVFP